METNKPIDDFFENRKLAEQNKLKNQKAYQDVSKKKLMASVKSKIKTTMIGGIAAFEANFGHLWGFGSNLPLTPEQLKYKAAWDEARTKALDTGNNQIRNAEEEISQYDLTRKKDTITFVLKGEQNNG